MLRGSAFRVAVVLAVVAAGCSYSREFRSPEQGGPRWVEVESAHFRVTSDTPPAEASRMAEEYEQLRQAILAGPWVTRVDPPGRLEVVVLRNPSELGEFTGQSRDRSPGSALEVGYFVPWERPRIVTGLLHDREAPSLALPPFQDEVTARARARESMVLEHELAHYLSFYVIPRQPRWLAEGLATYLQTTLVGTWQGKPAAVLGLPPTRDRGVYTARRAAPSELLRGTAFDYLWSGLFVHWLVNQRGAQFADYQRRLSRAEEPAKAWTGAFPELDPEDAAAMLGLDIELDRYLQAGHFALRRVLLAPASIPGPPRTLAPAEVHAVRSELFLTARVRRLEQARAELAESLRDDPSGVSAIVPLWFLRPGSELLALGRAAVVERPGDWRGGLLVALGGSERPDLAAERLAGLQQVAQAMPDDAFALNAGAWELHRLEASRDALPLAARAAALAPWSASVLDTYGAVLAGVGRCPEALAIQHRAVDLLGRAGKEGERGEGERPAPAEEIRRHLAEIEVGCQVARPAARR